MKDAFYFPHDSNAIQDPKMMSLLFECGLAGVGMYWIIIEILHQQEDGRISEQEFRKYMHFYFKVNMLNKQDQQVLNKIEQVFNTHNLLVFKDGFVYSERVLRNKEARQIISEKRSLAGKKSAQMRMFPMGYENSTQAEQVSTHVEHKKGKERKGNHISGDNGELKDKEPSPVKIVQEFFYEKYQAKHEHPCVPNWGKDGKIFKDLLAVLKPDQIKDLIILFFESEDEFIVKAGYSVGVFRSQINKLKCPVNKQSELLRKAGLIHEPKRRENNYR